MSNYFTQGIHLLLIITFGAKHVFTTETLQWPCNTFRNWWRKPSEAQDNAVNTWAKYHICRNIPQVFSFIFSGAWSCVELNHQAPLHLRPHTETSCTDPPVPVCIAVIVPDCAAAACLIVLTSILPRSGWASWELPPLCILHCFFWFRTLLVPHQFGYGVFIATLNNTIGAVLKVRKASGLQSRTLDHPTKPHKRKISKKQVVLDVLVRPLAPVWEKAGKEHRLWTLPETKNVPHWLVRLPPCGMVTGLLLSSVTFIIEQTWKIISLKCSLSSVLQLPV